MALSFSTKRKAGSWRENTKKQKDDAYDKLKQELAERDRIKEQRKRELDREAAIIGRTRGESSKLGVLAYMDVEVQAASGRMIFELFSDVVPRTVKNFVNLAKAGKYDGTVFYRVEPGVACTGGDVEHKNDGTGGGRDSANENHTLKHTNAGVLSMWCRKPNCNNSQFQILFEEQPHLDGRQVVFGRLVDGFAILREIEKAPSSLAKVVACVMIDDDGGLESIVEKYSKPVVLPKKADIKDIARNYRNKTNYYDNSTRSALFSWTTSC